MALYKWIYLLSYLLTYLFSLQEMEIVNYYWVKQSLTISHSFRKQNYAASIQSELSFWFQSWISFNTDG